MLIIFSQIEASNWFLPSPAVVVYCGLVTSESLVVNSCRCCRGRDSRKRPFHKFCFSNQVWAEVVALPWGLGLASQPTVLAWISIAAALGNFRVWLLHLRASKALVHRWIWITPTRRAGWPVCAAVAGLALTFQRNWKCCPWRCSQTGGTTSSVPS